MKHLVLFFLCAILFVSSYSQRRFIKTNSTPGYGSSIRIIPTNDQGWIIASMDSLRISKFDKCGKMGWSKKYLLPNEHPSLTDIISLRSGGFLLLTRKMSGISYACLITRFDTAGNIVWCKSYEDSYYDQYGYSLGEDSNGNLFLYANAGHVGSNGFNMVCKLNSSGNLIWSKFYDHGGTYGGAIVTSDDGMLFRTGDLFIKTDIAGNIEWSASGGSTGTYHYTTPVEVNDGYIYTKYKTSSRQIVFYKINRQGILVPGAVKISNYTGENPRLKVTSNGTVACIFNVGNYPTIVEIDKNLNVLRQGSINYNGLSFDAEDFCFSGGDAIISGTLGNSKIFFAKLDDLYKSSCDIILPTMQMQADSGNQMIYSTNVTNQTLAEVDHVYSSIDVIDEEQTVCTSPLELSLGPDTLFCSSSNFIIRNKLLGLFDEYQWSTGETTPYIFVNSPGIYWVTAAQNCEDSVVIDTVNIAVDSIPETDWNDKIIECENSNIILHAPGCFQCSYQWNIGETADSVVVSTSGLYIVNIENSNRCHLTDSVEVEFAKCDCEFYVPNSFTPNNDGLNEIFKPVYYCDLSNYELKIYNRWGQLVFTSNNPEEGWNGFKNIMGIEDVYNYMIQYSPILKGKAYPLVIKSGRVSLIY